MTEFDGINICSEGEFLAHVLALKGESEDRLQTLADCLHAHNNPLAGGVFQELAGHMRDAVGQLEVVAGGRELPVIPPWEYQWHCGNNPDSLCMDHAHYLMTVREALELALYNEQRSLAFLQRVHESCDIEAVRQLAAIQIEAEQRFESMVRTWLAELPEDDHLCDDIDPPHMPE